jgi:hypothetical protein
MHIKLCIPICQERHGHDEQHIVHATCTRLLGVHKAVCINAVCILHLTPSCVVSEICTLAGKASAGQGAQSAPVGDSTSAAVSSSAAEPVPPLRSFGHMINTFAAPPHSAVHQPYYGPAQSQAPPAYGMGPFAPGVMMHATGGSQAQGGGSAAPPPQQARGPGAASGSAPQAGGLPAQIDPVEMEQSVTEVIRALVAQRLVSADDGGMYISLWRLLGVYRQDAARRLLVAACSWQANLQAAVDHIQTVLSQNRG